MFVMVLGVSGILDHGLFVNRLVPSILSTLSYLPQQGVFPVAYGSNEI